jgi:hypothetical protein
MHTMTITDIAAFEKRSRLFHRFERFEGIAGFRRHAGIAHLICRSGLSSPFPYVAHYYSINK